MPQIVNNAYQIREVDGRDDEIADALTELHRLTFFSSASVPPFDWGHWWLAYREGTPVAFAGVVPSTHVRNAGYFCRVGVLQRHWGHRLQLRLMRAMETRNTRIKCTICLPFSPKSHSGPLLHLDQLHFLELV